MIPIIQVLVRSAFSGFLAIIAFGIVLRFFRANETNVFVQWVYLFSDILVSPFRGVFDSLPLKDSAKTFDLDSLLALVVYFVMGSLITTFFSNIAASARPNNQPRP